MEINNEKSNLNITQVFNTKKKTQQRTQSAIITKSQKNKIKNTDQAQTVQQLKEIQNIQTQKCIKKKKKKKIQKKKKKQEQNINQKQPISALCWSIHNAQNGNMLFSKMGQEIREMASLTKMMTLYVSYQLALQFKINIEQEKILVPKQATLIGGTSACLQENDYLSIKDLYYGLMLPSGNDAAITLANYFGYLLFKKKNNKKLYDIQANIYKFVKIMNKYGTKFLLKDTQFSNVHGLPSKSNRSCCFDMSKVAYLCIRIPIFKVIFNTKNYVCDIYESFKNQIRTIQWVNTNKLLWELSGEYQGLKTGFTDNAGHCLCLYYVNKQDISIQLIITVLCSKNAQKRFYDAENLAKWAVGQIKQQNQKVNQIGRNIRSSNTLNNSQYLKKNGLRGEQSLFLYNNNYHKPVIIQKNINEDQFNNVGLLKNSYKQQINYLKKNQQIIKIQNFSNNINDYFSKEKMEQLKIEKSQKQINNQNYQSQEQKKNTSQENLNKSFEKIQFDKKFFKQNNKSQKQNINNNFFQINIKKYKNIANKIKNIQQQQQQQQQQ
ncbi:hypothetical protein IMG5_119300 [Ichthyophthirius multifiliis]|uniref:Peptidase S11 D-alanyl-D-alanine carboxypeptidase A N-terminal domain-containing protein n=1 Tax=Ichthyophthirius multifiliis TaxID=5932 RepID=G0QUT8_ICHMU|nr:hypothetical protein IMG5_119300 [Ichthyophthirius multifiliis]EGR31018.1 hypothetical protein IMG5_119300 [Ichthyophthirius multifiliis]|eukprot:XP_004034504.1 hypothetical protein IMG5_119300 [Ichthyophthirius multifiliis]